MIRMAVGDSGSVRRYARDVRVFRSEVGGVKVKPKVFLTGNSSSEFDVYRLARLGTLPCRCLHRAVLFSAHTLTGKSLV